MSSGSGSSQIEALDALVLCGGLGTRLREAVPDRPKPLAPVAGRAFLDILLAHLAAEGVRRFVLCTGHRAEDVEREAASLARHGEIVLSCEATPLGTGGALRHALGHVCGDAFFALNGDSLCPISLADLLAFHRARRARVTLGLVPAETASEGGVVRLAGDGEVLAFEEKPARREGAFTNAGVYVMQREVLAGDAWPDAFSLERDAFPKLVGHGLFGLARAGSFLDIGTPERWSGAAERLAELGIALDARPRGDT